MGIISAGGRFGVLLLMLWMRMRARCVRMGGVRMGGVRMLLLGHVHVKWLSFEGIVLQRSFAQLWTRCGRCSSDGMG